jgi:transposase-like protein
MSEDPAPYNSVRKFTRSQKLKIRKEYLFEGYETSELATKYNIKPSLFRSYLFNSGLTKEKQRLANQDKEEISTEVNKATEYKTQRQLDYYSNLQEKTEELTEKALANAAEAEGIGELNTALGSVKSAVSLFEEASAKLGESLQTAGSVAESGNQYNFFYLDAAKGREILAKCKDQGKVIDI